MTESTPKEPPILPYVVVGILGMLNYSAFMAIAGWIGGDAWSGHQGNGHWYLTQAAKGQPRIDHEVSHGVYLYSLTHGCAAMLGFAVALGCFWITFVRIRAIFRSGGDPVTSRPDSPGSF